MPLVFAGACSHAPGITGRSDRADPVVRDEFYRNLDKLRAALEASKPDALIVIAAEHFANFFYDKMPAFALGMADHYKGPIEDEDWLAIRRVVVPGNAELSKSIITEIMKTVDLTYSEEWQFDHGIMVPLHFLTPRFDLPVIPVNINCQGPPLTPLSRTWEFGEAIRRACDMMPERIAAIATGGLSHWPATPDSGKINEQWDRDFLDQWCRNDKSALTSYTDEAIYEDAGQGGFEIRTFVAVAAAAQGHAELWFYAPIPIFAVGCTVGVMDVAPVKSREPLSAGSMAG
ncbi:MAG: extradiol ring-cleavage dioxygenase [Acidimicrobiales bacterium]